MLWSESPPPSNTNTLLTMVLVCTVGCFMGCAAYEAVKSKWLMYRQRQLCACWRNMFIMGGVVGLTTMAALIEDKSLSRHQDWIARWEIHRKNGQAKRQKKKETSFRPAGFPFSD